MEPSRILLVDDESSIRSGCCLALSEDGYTADSCDTGRAAIDALAKGSYDLVMLDIKLPDMNGM